jgi:S1-C subfamily serine protease
MLKLKRYLASTKSALPPLAGALVAILVVLVYLQLSPPDGRYSDADIQRLADERIEAITPTPPIEPEIYALVRPAVVLITRNNTTANNNNTRSLGSGVVIDTNGSILTAYHVIDGTDSVNVRFADGSTARATVTQKIPDKDLALLRVTRLPQGVEPAVLAGGVRQGDKVLAIGAPFGFEGTVTSGVVSALNRNFVVEETGQVINNMIQFDAAVNPGSSGGPLVDYNGRVVGIVSGIINPTDQRVFVGLGFAVPIEAAGSVLAPIS